MRLVVVAAVTIAFAPPKKTVLFTVVALKFEPVMVTDEPTVPDAGVIAVITGGDWARSCDGRAARRTVQSETARSAWQRRCHSVVLVRTRSTACLPKLRRRQASLTSPRDTR